MLGQPVTIEIGKYRKNVTDRQWELPPWGHPLSQGVMPLFITCDDHLFPVGTAFTVGRGLTFAVSAAHNIYEAVKRDERLRHRLYTNNLPTSVDLKQAGIALLYQRSDSQMGIWPLETVEGAPPTDIVVGYPQFHNGLATLVHRLSFDIPPVGETVWSIGYADMKPADGIPMADLRSGVFNLQRDYSHRLTVAEGTIERVFTHQFASGFVGGPCFTFDTETSHGQSGGPVMFTDGTVCGVNSAVTDAFGSPRSIASMLYPMLFQQLRFGANMGNVRLNASRTMIDLVFEGRIPTDGSEERIAVCHDAATGHFSISPKTPVAMAQYVHDDFPSFQEGKIATKQTKHYRFRRTEQPDGGDEEGAMTVLRSKFVALDSSHLGAIARDRASSEPERQRRANMFAEHLDGSGSILLL